jgi:lipoprotein-anchoring transpeptidase ErfK/SrfK
MTLVVCWSFSRSCGFAREITVILPRALPAGIVPVVIPLSTFISIFALLTVQSAPSAPASQPGSAELRTTAARQAALDRAGFSPGLIDGKTGPKTRFAVREFQGARKLPLTGEFDQPTLAALRVVESKSFVTYTVSASDIADVGPAPSDWNAKARLDRLRFESIEALLAERGHCTKAFVAFLNPGKNIAKLSAGGTVTLPFVEPEPTSAKAAALEVDLENKTVRARDAADRTLLVFHCSIAANVEKRPAGRTRVVVVKMDPEYSFKPEMWPEVTNVREQLLIPAGPRNPVGLCWIGVGLPGYGIHGTPNPELIGKTGSHGCIRLANWDAVRLGKIVAVETPVEFISR